jgi:hypothetical protein
MGIRSDGGPVCCHAFVAAREPEPRRAKPSEIALCSRKERWAIACAGQSHLFLVGAEGVGFEPTETRNASPVFKTGAIGH